MKKIIILCLLSIFAYTETNALIKVNYHKDKWRLFGYKNINETFTKLGNNCSFNIDCDGFGFSRCKFTTYNIKNPSLYGCQAIVVNNSSDNDWVGILDEDIKDKIANGYTSGTFVRQDIQVSHPTTNNMENAVVT